MWNRFPENQKKLSSKKLVLIFIVNNTTAIHAQYNIPHTPCGIYDNGRELHCWVVAMDVGQDISAYHQDMNYPAGVQNACKETKSVF
jgi:hypothetical protein